MPAGRPSRLSRRDLAIVLSEWRRLRRAEIRRQEERERLRHERECSVHIHVPVALHIVVK